MNISDIKIGNRIRKNIGDISALADSIKDVGLLQPIVINQDDKLLIGYRRILAIQQLGWNEIEVKVIDNVDGLLNELKIERDENTCRLDFTPSEAVEMAKEIEPLEKEAAKERQEMSNTERANLAPSDKGKARDKTAEAVGMKKMSYSKAKSICQFCDDNPEYEYIRQEMDETGKIDRASKEMNRVQRLIKRQEQKVEVPQSNSVWHGDFREVGQKIPDNSVDLVFTDPPYNEDAIELYRDLGIFASRVLKPGGLCLAYSGQIFLPQVLNALSENLEYIWCFAIRHSSGYTRIFKFNGRNIWKPIVFFAKKPYRAWWKTLNDMVDGKMEKDTHEWQQALNEAEYYLSQLVPKGGLVIDPFCGSGTTLVAAKKLGYRYIGIEDDKNDVKKSIQRLEND